MKTILVVDDSATSRLLFKAHMPKEGDYRIVEAANLEQAMERVGAEHPDLVFLDVQMPGLDGFGVIKRLVDRKVPLPQIVFATAFDQYAVKAFEVNAVDYLLKPVGAERLARCVAPGPKPSRNEISASSRTVRTTGKQA